MKAMSEKGFARPIYSELLQEMEAKAQDLLGQDIDTSEQSFLGKLMRILAFEYAEMYEDLEEVYYTRFPDYASGVNLDRLLSFVGITRNPAVAAVHKVKITGKAGTTLKAGTCRVTNGNGLTFALLDDVELEAEAPQEAPAEGEADVVAYGEFACTIRGTVGNINSKDIQYAEGSGSWRPEGESLLVAGAEAESDFELRRRWKIAGKGMGSATIDAVQTEVMRVPGVVSCTVEENDTDKLVNGIPPHAFACYVLSNLSKDPGHPNEIAAAIFRKKPVGIRCVSVGASGDNTKVEVEVPDSTGKKHPIGFNWANDVPLKMEIAVKVGTDFPLNGEVPIRQAIVRAIERLGNGEDVMYTSLFPLIYSVPGVKDVPLLKVGREGGALGQENIEISIKERAKILANNIQVARVENGDG